MAWHALETLDATSNARWLTLKAQSGTGMATHGNRACREPHAQTWQSLARLDYVVGSSAAATGAGPRTPRVVPQKWLWMSPALSDWVLCVSARKAHLPAPGVSLRLSFTPSPPVDVTVVH